MSEPEAIATLVAPIFFYHAMMYAYVNIGNVSNFSCGNVLVEGKLEDEENAKMIFRWND